MGKTNDCHFQVESRNHPLLYFRRWSAKPVVFNLFHVAEHQHVLTGWRTPRVREISQQSHTKAKSVRPMLIWSYGLLLKSSFALEPGEEKCTLTFYEDMTLC